METFKNLGIDFEVIITNDNSSDGTGEIAETIANGHSNVSCKNHARNMGVGAAFRTGVEHARKDYVIFVPVDNPLDPEDVEMYLPRMGVCDIVVGVRVERIGYHWFAKFTSFTYNRIMVPLFFNIGLSDVNWIQVYRRNLFTDKIINFENNGVFFLVEILVKARRNRLIVAEVPARMKKRVYGRPTSFRFPIILQTFWAMLKFFFNSRKANKQP